VTTQQDKAEILADSTIKGINQAAAELEVTKAKPQLAAAAERGSTEAYSIAARTSAADKNLKDNQRRDTLLAKIAKNTSQQPLQAAAI
jgi:hypothetical protein